MSFEENLECIGLKAESYKRGPSGKHNFAIGLHGDILKFWTGSADVTVRKNSKKRQCLITVVEPKRTVIEKYQKEYSKYYFKGAKLPTNLEKAKSNFVHLNFGPSRWDCKHFVPRSKFSSKIISFTKKEETVFAAWEIKQVAPKTVTTFLVGYDESDSTKPFICVLKNNPTSFQEAYDSLKPRGIKLKKGYKRQGEWFLNPASKDLNDKLMKKINKAKIIRLNGAHKTRYGWSKPPSSHQGLCIRYNKKLYAIGVVKDVRKGRHRPITLTKWHEVIRNNEAVMPETAPRNYD